MPAAAVRARATLLAALACAVPALPSVAATTVRASHAALGRDQGIFHYVAWAAMRGEVLYRDVRDVNGPLVALIHGFVLAALGSTDRAFRVFDLVSTGLSFAVLGACLVDLDDARTRGAARVVERAAWALAAWSALSAQYLLYDFWDTAQRESFFDVFVAGALAAALVAQRKIAVEGPSRASTWLLASSGFLSVLPCTGKPTFLLFTAGQLAALLVDRLPVARRRRLVPFALGGLAALLVMTAFLVRVGDVRAFVAISRSDVPAMYRFIWPRPLADMWATWAPVIAFGLATSGGALVLVVRGRLPRRALALALLPALGLLSVLAQGKGFPYHFHPVTLGGTFALLAALRVASGPQARRGPLAVATATVLAFLVGARGAHGLEVVRPFAASAPDASPAERLALHERIDFFPRGLHDAAAFLEANTAPDARVFAYGMDAYVLFLAHRRSAVPYIYAYDLDVDAALAGASVYGRPPPTDAERATIRAIGSAHAADLARRLEASPPAAVVLVDRSPLMTQPVALVDLAACCRDAAAFVRWNYVEAASFEGVHVWLPQRADRNLPVTGSAPE